ncbi:YceG family protein [Kurthia sibirica]|uniref:Putative component of 'biosynthetic module' domain-containing protein n=1 Tax=Kurthia sibirica TaxID=202750 RepID=A0A2U3AJN9_9BACL|nr:YceG family protein [Kurthia sibirica]PWI24759.1 hypothetical protein DEX24_11570 [Kurthia sibirica]GEK35127.1 hypothetical protein KSI01_26600 [Kurthia sibirica]
MKGKKINVLLYANQENWLQTFHESVKLRPNYIQNEELVQFEAMALRVNGVPLDHDEYFNMLVDLEENDTIFVLSEHLDKTIDQRDFQALQEILQRHTSEPKGLSINRLVAMMYGSQLLPKLADDSLNRHLQLKVIEVLSMFQQQQSFGLLSNDFRRVLIDLVKWLKNHWAKWMATSNVDDEFPRIVWYGPLKPSEKYFIVLLIKLGCDVLLFDPTGEDAMIAIDQDEQFTKVYNYSEKIPLEPFPSEKRQRQSTVGYRSSQHFDRLLTDGNAGVFKAWQFQHHIPQALTLRMTYDDIFIYAKEKAMIRPEFKVENKHVIIPVIFAKISGVTTNRDEYWSRLHQLIGPQTLLLKQFPYMQASKSNFQFHYNHSLDKGRLSADKMMQSDWWQYREFPAELQKAMAVTIINCCENPTIKLEKGESPDALSVTIFKYLAQIPEEIIRLLQNYDYAQDIPKIVVYDNGQGQSVTREDAILLAFLNRFGLDIVLYNPTGKLDIEHYITEQSYDVHRLDDMVFDMAFQEVTVSGSKKIKKFFDRLF